MSSKDEQKLVDWLVELLKRGFGGTREDLKDMAKKILDERGATTIFKNNRPGKDWVQAFFKRHPQVAERTSHALGGRRELWYRRTDCRPGSRR
ncbi:hypothetical protein BaRGS_00035149 [Batillaria attramentaria]|uniref:HTH CENPB-type domain-containing protein n=1 Tax=Batillaria attramentaria TaxID=370345 RepID=A0ABD0JFA7_9CAEN